MSEKVMVAVDNRGISESVLDWLTDRGKGASDASEIEIEIVTVAELGWLPAGSPEVDYRNSYEQALWSARRAVASALPDAAVTSTMEWGIPVEELVTASSRADLLVLGSDKTGVIAGFISGTVPLRVSAHSACTVVVVPSGWRAGKRDVVVGVSLDASDDAVIEFAARQAQRSGGSLRIVHALPLPQSLLSYDAIAPVTVDEIRDPVIRILDVLRTELTTRFPDVEVTATSVLGRAARALTDEARDSGIVVVGTHGRGVLRRLVLGSVSHDLLLNSRCPVAIVHNTNREVASGR